VSEAALLQMVGASHPGHRDHNEDCYAIDAEQGLALVADGMGGYACGGVASELVRSSLLDGAAG
jgi:protein phosphatase